MVPLGAREFNRARVFFDLSDSEKLRPVFGTGPDWKEALDHATRFMTMISKSLDSPPIGIVSGDPPRKRIFVDKGFHCVSTAPWLQGGPFPMRMHAARPARETLIFINPYYVHLGRHDIEHAFRLCEQSGKPVVSVRAPLYHPLLYMEWRRIEGVTTQVRIGCDAWSSDSFYLYVDGKTLQFRRQNFPDVVTYCNAILVAPAKDLSFLRKTISKGKFIPYRLAPDRALDYSYRIERLLGEATRDLSRTAG